LLGRRFRDEENLDLDLEVREILFYCGKMISRTIRARVVALRATLVPSSPIMVRSNSRILPQED
jgi:hypothetical protein